MSGFIWKYKTHINVEICTSIEIMKYLNKYIYKRSDQTCLQMQHNSDEIDWYLQNHYINLTETVWQIFLFKMHEEYSSVISLSVYFSDNQLIYFEENMTSQKMHNQIKMIHSMLISFFHYNVIFLMNCSIFIQYFSSILCERKMKSSENLSSKKIILLTACITAVLFRMSNSIFNFFLQLFKISKALKIYIQFEIIFIQHSS